LQQFERARWSARSVAGFKLSPIGLAGQKKGEDLSTERLPS
jgi:hypothetical protein